MPSDPPLHGRHRDKNGEIGRKHGNTLVRTLRKAYGQHFAEGCDDKEKATSARTRSAALTPSPVTRVARPQANIDPAPQAALHPWVRTVPKLCRGCDFVIRCGCLAVRRR